jgi:uncharacterized membrane protein YraQ (UPF0718 family)
MWQNAQTIFLSIILESLPFILLGVIVSSLIQEVIPQEKWLRFFPRQKGRAVLFASLLGLVIPVCDCGTIPVARSLIRKGVPVAAAVTFTLAAPVVNPITMTATYVAFGMDSSFMWLRTGVTLSISLFIGWLLLAVRDTKMVLRYEQAKHRSTSERSIKHKGKKIGRALEHSLHEFFEVGIFVVLSAAVAALLQTLAPPSLFTVVGAHPIWSVGGMMGLGSLLSLCSEADAFVARSLAGLTTAGGVVGFLVIGQMIDMRNLFLFPRVFRMRITVITFMLATLLTLALGILINIWHM